MKMEDEIKVLCKKIQRLDEQNEVLEDITSFMFENLLQRCDKNTKNDALSRFKAFIPEWKPGKEYKMGSFVSFGTDIFEESSKEKQIYMVNFQHVAVERWKPGQEDRRPTQHYTPVKC